jgi:ribosome maturation factor RimP
VLRLYIESEAGVQVDDCARVSDQVGALLDVEEPLSGDYVLEVSSPGIDRRLFTLEQCAAYVGEAGGSASARPFEGRRRFRGVLRGVEQEDWWYWWMITSICCRLAILIGRSCSCASSGR